MELRRIDAHSYLLSILSAIVYDYLWLFRTLYPFAISIVYYAPLLSATTCYHWLSSAIIEYYLLPPYNLNCIIVYYFVVFSVLICYYLLLSAILCSTASNVSWYHLIISSTICYHLLPYLLSHFLLLVSSIIFYYLIWSVIIFHHPFLSRTICWYYLLFSIMC